MPSCQEAAGAAHGLPFGGDATARARRKRKPWLAHLGCVL